MKLFGWLRRRARGPAAAPPGAVPTADLSEGLHWARNLAGLWGEIDAIAREDGLRGRSAVEHFNLTSEGKKDVERWLNIYLRRLRPGHAYSLPAHLNRHRGYCLVPRLWPEGLRWAAVHDGTLFRAPIPEEPERGKLIEALDRYLDAEEKRSGGR